MLKSIYLTAAGGFALLMLIGIVVANAEGERFFVGSPQLIGTEGYGLQCNRGQTLTLRLLPGNILSNMKGTCNVPLRPDGSYTGECNFPGERLQVTGKLSGQSINHQTRQTLTGVTCVYTVVLQETRQ
jgi:hypothetical protein